MVLTVHSELSAYLGAVRDFLETREAENGLLLGNLAEAPFMAHVEVDRTPVFSAFYRDINLILAGQSPPGALEAVAAGIQERGIKLPGVVGPAGEAERFAELWSKMQGCPALLAMRQRIYELREVIWPPLVPGGWRLAGSQDAELLRDWVWQFHQEALGHLPYSLEEAAENARRRVTAQLTFLWDRTPGSPPPPPGDPGQAVAMAALSRPTRRGYSVNAVFTPPAWRGQGYASALVAAVSSEALRRGKEFCVLYTDLDNPTSNKIYQKIGYRPVGDSRNYRFG